MIRSLPALRLQGLMTMPPFFDDPDSARPYFASLRELRDRLVASRILAPEMKELSMGMTGDFEVAVEEGATMVRIGTALIRSPVITADSRSRVLLSKSNHRGPEPPLL